MNAAELAVVLENHGKWLRKEEGGIRADLSAADLSRADLSDANLRGANLSGADLSAADLSDAYLRRADLSGADLSAANLSGADLSAADLSRADLSGADLSAANLSGADLSAADLSGADLSAADLSAAYLSGIRDDLRRVLDAAPDEVHGLLLALQEGRINGSTYEGECACLVGTIANVRGCRYNELGDLRPNDRRPAEKWFLAVGKGATPKTNPVAEITEGWIKEWLAEQPSTPVQP